MQIKAEELLRKKGLLNNNVVAIKSKDKILDLNSLIQNDQEIEPIFLDDPQGLEIMRHSTSHVMADAVKQIFPKIRLGIGPAIKNGFYYDFDSPEPFSLEDLQKIEAKMKEIIQKDYPFIKKRYPKKEALALFKRLKEDLKVELLEEIQEDYFTVYQHGNFLDLCVGPHLPRTGFIKAFKLTNIAGAYWKGDERRKMLQRIYGTAFVQDKDLEAHLKTIEEAKLRDHRRLGKELGLFSLQQEVGPGLVLWHPEGAKIRNVIEEFWRAIHLEKGYEIIFTPHIAKADLWKKSGHLTFFQSDTFSKMEIEGVDYILRPMNCPFHISIYKNRLRSFRELPIRLAELGTVYRYERSGVLHGLLRVRGFTQDDGHIFLRKDQMEKEIKEILKLSIGMLKAFGFEKYNIYLSTQPEECIGDRSIWEESEKALQRALSTLAIPYQIDKGGGAFYGPKIDIKILDALERAWQCTTIQLDFNLPERFDITYVDSDGQRKRPVMIHRAIFGSLERFLGILTEHYKGAFPAWFSPCQVIIITISERHVDYGKEIKEMMLRHKIRVKSDFRNESLGYKIREARLKRYPYWIIIGDKEVSSRKISLRARESKKQELLSQEETLARIIKETRFPKFDNFN